MAARDYTIRLTIANPMTGRTRQLFFQFDKDSLDQAKWNAAFPSVLTELNTLKTESTTVDPKEPATW